MYVLQYPLKSTLDGALTWITIPNEVFATNEEAHARAVELQHKYPWPIVVVIPIGDRHEAPRTDL